MRRIRNILRKKSNEKASQVAGTEDAEDAINQPLDNTAFGLDVWVPGIDPIVEYVSLFLSFSSIYLAYIAFATS